MILAAKIVFLEGREVSAKHKFGSTMLSKAPCGYRAGGTRVP